MVCVVCVWKGDECGGVDYLQVSHGGRCYSETSERRKDQVLTAVTIYKRFIPWPLTNTHTPLAVGARQAEVLHASTVPRGRGNQDERRGDGHRSPPQAKPLMHKNEGTK